MNTLASCPVTIASAERDVKAVKVCASDACGGALQQRIASASQERPGGRVRTPPSVQIQRFTDEESPDLPVRRAFGNVTASLRGREG